MKTNSSEESIIFNKIKNIRLHCASYQKTYHFDKPMDMARLYQIYPLSKGPFFDSSLRSKNGRFQFFASDPDAIFQKTHTNQWQCLSDDNNLFLPFDFLKWLKNNNDFKSEKKTSLPFEGGFMGFISYDYNPNDEKLPSKTNPFPLVHFYLVGSIICFDLEKNELILISYCPEKLKQMQQATHYSLNKSIQVKKIIEITKPQPKVNQTTYFENIHKIFEYIKAGDIYQANYTHPFTCHFTGDPYQIYLALRKANPSPFAACYPIAKDKFILSSSPERLFQVNNNVIQSRPIKGTIKRMADPTADQIQKETLLNSEKDSAELAMIVDLIRNDLGKICQFATVKVTEWKSLESYQKVHHLVSNVQGLLKESINLDDILKALHPGGSITGAPKIRSMQILAELETNSRGPYTGSIGYLDFSGNMDFNILIRTIVLCQNELKLQVGGGIVIDSTPEKEYQESLDKAEALLDAIKNLSNQNN